MQIHNIKRKTKNKKKMIVARGGTRGKTAGRGTKGQKARSGHKIRPEIRDLIKRIPKMRGRGKNSNLTIQEKPVTLSVEALELIFSAGETVSRVSLVEHGLVTMRNGKIPTVKILGDGDLKKKLMIKGLVVSASAKAKIEKAGGSIS
jgi:large subunit ribosomal protein L15